MLFLVFFFWFSFFFPLRSDKMEFANSVFSAASNVASQAASQVSRTVQYVAGVQYKTVETYLGMFLNQNWSGADNPLEPAGIDTELYVFRDGQGPDKNLLTVMKAASAKNRQQRGMIISLIQGEDDRFFFKTLTSVSFGEGFTNENGLDLSFESQDYMSFGMIVLKNGKVVLHEQRSDERKEAIKKK